MPSFFSGPRSTAIGVISAPVPLSVGRTQISAPFFISSPYPWYVWAGPGLARHMPTAFARSMVAPPPMPTTTSWAFEALFTIETTVSTSPVLGSDAEASKRYRAFCPKREAKTGWFSRTESTTKKGFLFSLSSLRRSSPTPSRERIISVGTLVRHQG